MKNKLYLTLALIGFSLASATAQTRRMTMDEADSIAVNNNLKLKASLLDIDAAEGLWTQAKRLENPEVQLMHNVQNPENRKWMDMGYEGQTDIQVSQPIAIGGQRRNKVRQAEAALNASRATHDATALDVRHEARTTFIDLYNAQQKLKVYDKEIGSVEKIHNAYEEQSCKGNVSRMQAFRIAAMLSQLRADKAEMQLCVNELKARLSVLLNIDGTEDIEAVIDEDSAISSVAENLALLQPLTDMRNTSLLQDIIRNHPEMTQARYEEESAAHAVKAEKADALPHISLNGEWDKNGSIGHNFFAVGATVTVPLWNRNRGNIRSAKAQHERSVIERQQKEQELRTALTTHYNATLQSLKLVEEQKKHLATDLDQLMEAAEQQVMKRNITVVEFVDLYSSYRDTRFQMEDAKAMLIKSNEELKKYTR